MRWFHPVWHLCGNFWTGNSWSMIHDGCFCKQFRPIVGLVSVERSKFLSRWPCWLNLITHESKYNISPNVLSTSLFSKWGIWFYRAPLRERFQMFPLADIRCGSWMYVDLGSWPWQISFVVPSTRCSCLKNIKFRYERQALPQEFAYKWQALPSKKKASKKNIKEKPK